MTRPCPRKFPRPWKRSRGFTLLELMAVLAVMALLSAVVSLSLASVSSRTTVRDAVGAITDMDRSMRSECKEFNRVGELRFDPDSGQITRVARRDGEAVDVESYRLPESLRLEKVWIQDQKNPRGRSGTVVIRCDARGRSPTYAISIRPPDVPPAPRNTGIVTPGKLPRELPRELSGGVLFVVAGLTGQVQECQDESQIIDLFAAF